MDMVSHVLSSYSADNKIFLTRQRPDFLGLEVWLLSRINFVLPLFSQISTATLLYGAILRSIPFEPVGWALCYTLFHRLFFI